MMMMMMITIIIIIIIIIDSFRRTLFSKNTVSVFSKDNSSWSVFINYRSFSFRATHLKQYLNVLQPVSLFYIRNK